MRTLSFASACGLSLFALAAGCGLIAGVKDRTLAEGSGGSTGVTTATATTTTVAVATSVGAGGQGGTSVTTGAGGAGGSDACPTQAPGVVTLLCHENKPTSLVVAGSLLFWANEGDGSVRSIPAVGGEIVTTVAKDQAGVCGLVFAAGAVYWRTTEGFVRRRSLSMPSDPVEDIAFGQGSSCAIAADKDSVYWVKVVPGVNLDVIRSAAHENISGQSDVVKQVAQVDSLDATDPQSIYWASKGKQSVYGALKQNGMITSVGIGTAPCAARVLGLYVYWTDCAAGKIFKVSLDGSSPTSLAMGAHNPSALVPFGAYVYWVDEMSAGSVNRILDTFSSNIEPLAHDQSLPSSIAVDPTGTAVYWTTRTGGEILRLPLVSLP